MSYDFSGVNLIADNTTNDFSLVHAIIEQEFGTHERVRWSEEKKEFVPKGVYMEIPLPAPYGWLPQTLSSADKTALDVLVLSKARLAQGAYLTVRPIGIMLREDQDHKILAVDINDPEYGYFRDYSELDKTILAEFENWFSRFFILNGWADAQQARLMIKDAHLYYLQTAKEKGS